LLAKGHVPEKGGGSREKYQPGPVVAKTKRITAESRMNVLWNRKSRGEHEGGVSEMGEQNSKK